MLPLPLLPFAFPALSSVCNQHGELSGLLLGSSPEEALTRTDSQSALTETEEAPVVQSWTALLTFTETPGPDVLLQSSCTVKTRSPKSP